MIELFIALALFGAVDQTAAEEGGPREWSGIRWEVWPMPSLPSRFEGTIQAEVTCVARERGRVSDCQIVRFTPREHENLRRGILRALHRARYADPRVSPGDHLRFVMTACLPAEAVRVCPRIPWDDAQNGSVTGAASDSEHP